DRRPGGAEDAGWDAGFSAEWHAAVATSAAAAHAALLRNLIERFNRLVEIGRVRFRGARLARPARKDIAARLAERHLLFLLALVELHGDGERRLVESGL